MEPKVKKVEEKLFTIYELEATKISPDNKNLEYADKFLAKQVKYHRGVERKKKELACFIHKVVQRGGFIIGHNKTAEGEENPCPPAEKKEDDESTAKEESEGSKEEKEICHNHKAGIEEGMEDEKAKEPEYEKTSMEIKIDELKAEIAEKVAKVKE